MARVIGPTPPGLGDRTRRPRPRPGPRRRPGPSSVRVIPTSSTTAPGLDHVRGDQPRHPGRGHHDVGAARVRRQVTVPVWHSVTVAFSLRRVSSSPSGRPTVTPRPTTHDLGAAERHAVAAQQLDDAARRARQRSRASEHQPAEVGRVQPVGVLGRVDLAPAPGSSSSPRGQRQLDDEAGAGRVGVELARPRPPPRPASRRPAGPCGCEAIPDLGAVAVLAGDVGVAARVVADQHRAEPGHDARARAARPRAPSGPP